MSYEPPLSHPVFLNGNAINTQNWATGTNGVMIDEIIGWLGDASDIRQSAEPNPGRDGERPGNTFKGGRTITLKGKVSGSTYADLQANKLALAAKFDFDDEVVFKMPAADQSSPTWTHSSSIAGFERADVRVIDGVVFGGQDGPLIQEWVCSLRASDNRIYSDVLTTSATGSSVGGGTAATPPVITATVSGTTNGWAVITESTAGLGNLLVATGFSGLVDASGTVPKPQFVLDVGERDPYIRVPHAQGKLTALSPIALWKFDETSGVTADNAQGTATYDGTIAGAPAGMGATGPFTGSKSLTLDGVNDAVQVPFNAALHPSEFTIEGWFKATSSTLKSVLEHGTNGGIVVNASTAMITVFGVSGAGVGTLLGLAAGTYTGWTHVAVTYKDGNFRLFVNGTNISTVRYTYVTPVAGSTNFGIIAAGGTWFPGNISSWAIYGTSLSPAEVLALADASDGRWTYRAGASQYIKGLNWVDLPANGVVTALTAAGDFTTPPTMTYRTARV